MQKRSLMGIVLLIALQGKSVAADLKKERAALKKFTHEISGTVFRLDVKLEDGISVDGSGDSYCDTDVMNPRQVFLSARVLNGLRFMGLIS